MVGIPRKLPNASLAEWDAKKPTLFAAMNHVQRVIACAPKDWQLALKGRFDGSIAAQVRGALSDAQFLAQPPQWAQAWDLMQAVSQYEREFGDVVRWDLDDWEVREMASELAAQADELDALALSQGADVAGRLDVIRMLVRCVGICEDKAIAGEPGIKRAQDACWWRRQLRVHVARKMESGYVQQGLVHRGGAVYVSEQGLVRRQAQIKRNQQALARVVFKNEAGQFWRLDELAKLGVSNPVVRGGELMTRIRGAEEYADARAHVGIFITLTTPSRFHAVTLKHGRALRNPHYEQGLLPRDAQAWLCKNWQRVRAALHRRNIKFYGLRVAEPHHDATPHWHMLLWVEGEREAQLVQELVLDYWLRDTGGERGASEYRVNFKRMVKGGAAGYVAKYITKSVGQMALLEHRDVVDGQQISMDFGDAKTDDCKEVTLGHQRVDAWAATWRIRQFQLFGMPSVTVWRELRRVTRDQMELFSRGEDVAVTRAFQACHRSGHLRADWRLFMEAMGGHGRKRCEWHLRVVQRENIDEKPNKYGEVLPFVRVVGLRVQRGRWHGQELISRRIAWAAATPDEAGAALAAMEQAAEAGVSFRQALPAAWTWTCFNNCTARMGGGLRREVFGPGDHHNIYAKDWATPDVLAHFRRQRAMEAMQ